MSYNTSYEYEIDENTTYPSDQKISVIRYADNIIVVSPLSANWIVLRTSTQLDIFNQFLLGKSIKDILNMGIYDETDIIIVVTQIEAKRFFSKATRNISDKKKTLHLYLTNKCNLSCPHCYMFSGQASNEELTTSEIISIISDYSKIANGSRITISGGEPTTHIDFDKIIKKCYDLGLEINLLTNGTLLSRDKADNLARYITSVQISIDGFSEESNSLIRGRGNFQKALDCVDAFTSNGVETSIAITPSLKLLESCAAEYINFARMILSKYNEKVEVRFAEALSSGRNVSPTLQSNSKYSSIVNDIQKEIYGEQFDLISFIEQMKDDIILDNCMFGTMTIASNGDVFFCPDVGSLTPVANIRTTSFNNIYTKSLVAERNTKIHLLRPCNECDLIYICGGGCRTENFPTLVNRSSFDNIDFENHPYGKCSQKTKERFYRLMIESNEYLYRKL